MVTAFVVLLLAAVTLFVHILINKRASHRRERLHRKLNLTFQHAGNCENQGKRMSRRIIYMVLLAMPVAAQSRNRVSGTVRAGDTFRKEVSPGLTLVLAPDDSPDTDGDSGWSIEVQPADKSDNFIRCVNLPLHGPTVVDILASQFVTEDNKKLPESALSDKKKREFQFVLNGGDQKKACDELGVVAYRPPKTTKDGTVIIGTPGYKDPPLGSGTLTIKALQLSNLGPAKHARIEILSFEAEISFPPGKNRSSKSR